MRSPQNQWVTRVGYSGLEVSVYDMVVNEDVKISVEALESDHVVDLSPGLSVAIGMNCDGQRELGAAILVFSV